MERTPDRDVVGVFEVASEGHPVGDSGEAHPRIPESIRDEVGGGFARGVGVRRPDALPDPLGQ